MSEDSILKRNWVKGSAVLATAALSLVLAAPVQAAPLAKVKSATQGATENVVEVTFQGGDGADVKGRITFLEEGVFRYNVDPTGTFDEYAVPRQADHVAHIQAQPDSDSSYSHPKATVEDKDGAYLIKSGSTTIKLDKESAKMQVLVKDKEVMSEASPLDLGDSTVQSVSAGKGEGFFGGGTQNGRFAHRGKSIKIANTNNWVDGGVASPNPFYWSSDGYGVLRNTFAEGTYDFADSDSNAAKLTHNENEFDAYYFLSDGTSRAAVAQDVLDGYFAVTGDPVLLPEYGFYLGHLNAYNRDSWTKEGPGKAWETKGGKPADQKGSVKYEHGMAADYVPDGTKPNESLNGHGPTVDSQNFKPKEFPREFSAQQVIDDYQDNDMPFGWFLPNDGYGAGYGQNGYGITSNDKAKRDAAIDANVANLREFTTYANSHGVATGLWTQSNLEPRDGEKWHLQRDFKKEVEQGGISTLKTDVAWVGSGYSFGLNGIKKAYDIATSDEHKARVRPNIVTLDGWAGTQRYGGIWTGDQTGGNWEYIRFHLPTYIGQSLSGNPNVGSDMDGIFGGAPIIATRDYQWKTFTPTMLDMDGWGTYRKSPMTHGDPYTGISRMYLKLKAQLMPYIYTSAASAANIDTGNGDTGLPMIRAMLLTDDSEFAASTATQYQYTFGKYFLVAPVYQNTADSKGNGDDVRNGIYLPNYGSNDNPTVWIDYFTGEQYRGGQVINNFDAPLWKLPLFVQAGAIVPMYEENNNPQAISETNKKGLDKTRRIVEFWPAGGSEYTLFEDDGKTINSNQKNVEGYGVVENVDYGTHVSTKITSKVSGDTATLTIGASTGSYAGCDANRSTTAVVNVSKEPSAITYGGKDVKRVESKEAFDKAKANGAGAEAVWYYEKTPDLNTTDEDEGFGKTEIKTTPKVYVFLPKTDVSKAEQVLVVKGFANSANLDADKENSKLTPAKLVSKEEDKTPTSIKLTWEKVAGATSYELMVDGVLNSVGDASEFTHTDLSYHSTHTYQIRSRNAEGYSKWSEPIESTSLEDPWRNAPKPVETSWEGGYYGGFKESLALDHSLDDSHFHSDANAIGKAMVFNYGQAMMLDKFEYYPRNDAANGTVTKMRIETSLDGNHWSKPVELDWNRDNKVKTYTFPSGAAAQYVRLTPLASVGNFFSARELAVYKKDGTKMWEVGSNKQDPSVSENDFTNMKNYLGVENRAPHASTFNSQIAGHYADLNNNGIYDVYDYSFTMAKLDDGTKKGGKVSGSVEVVADKEHVAPGDVVTVSVMARNARNANALGAVVNFMSDEFELQDSTIAGASCVAGMENLSVAMTNFTDGKQSVNVAFANRGDKALFNGSEAVATFKLKAKKETDVKLPYISMLVGPKFDVVELATDENGNLPEQPGGSRVELTQDDFNIKITNKGLPKDEDGTNVTKMIQGGSYGPLFDGVEHHDGNEGKGVFELKWGGNDDVVSIEDMNISFELKEPRALADVQLVNRMNQAGEVGGNGFLSKVAAVMTFEDGSTQKFEGGEFDKKQGIYTFAPSKENAAKKVVKVDIKPLETPDVHMLTISEINFSYVEGAPAPEEEVKELEQGDFDIRATNEGYPVDDGENVKKLVQQGNYDGLFNGDNADRAFEFKWFIDAASFDEKVGLPANISFELKKPRALKNVELHNGDKGKNGSINKIEAVVTFTDDSVQEFKGGDFDKNQPTYLFEISEENKDKKVARVEIKPLESTGTATGLEKPNNRMLTIGEINFNYVEGAEKPEKPQVDKTELQAKYDEFKGCKAEDYTAESWKPFAIALDEAAKVLADESASQDQVGAALDKLTAAYGALVKSDVAPQEKPDKSALEALVAEAGKLDTEGKTPALVERLNAAIAGANAVLGDDAATDEQVKAAFDELKAAIDALKGDAGSEGNNGSDSNGGSDNNGGDNNGTAGNGSTGGQGSGNGTAGGQGGSNASGLPQTGDPATVAVAATGISGAIAAFFGAFRRRKDK